MTPEQALYHFPSMSKVETVKRAKRYYKRRCIAMISDIAEQLGLVAVFTQGNWRQKKKAIARARLDRRFVYLYPPHSIPEGATRI